MSQRQLWIINMMCNLDCVLWWVFTKSTRRKLIFAWVINNAWPSLYVPQVRIKWYGKVKLTNVRREKHNVMNSIEGDCAGSIMQSDKSNTLMFLHWKCLLKWATSSLLGHLTCSWPVWIELLSRGVSVACFAHLLNFELKDVDSEMTV